MRCLCPEGEGRSWSSFSQQSTKPTERLHRERSSEGLATALWRLLGKRHHSSSHRVRPQVVTLGRGSVSIAACSTRPQLPTKPVKVLKRGKALLRYPSSQC